ncbi:class I SAM-dependent methyltransferase [Lentisphaerota bacterium WC36G]|nr:class I SAM-dependent methyltransferase [Lentisphaerae bacterium WC36]
MDQSSLDQQNKFYWNEVAEDYQELCHITVENFHYAPLIAGDDFFKLLPNDLSGLKALEIGAGGAQNSIYLAMNGVNCIANDISEKQLKFASELAERYDVELGTLCCPMDNLINELDITSEEDKFDIIHSSYALSFSSDPKKLVQNLSKILKKDGIMLISTGHPAFAGEWLDLGEDDLGEGMFLKDYFTPQADTRYDEDGQEIVRSTFYTVGEMFDWFASAQDLTVERVIEPQAMDLSNIEYDDIINVMPYFSHDWMELHEQARHIPLIVIIKVRKN